MPSRLLSRLVTLPGHSQAIVGARVDRHAVAKTQKRGIRNPGLEALERGIEARRPCRLDRG